MKRYLYILRVGVCIFVGSLLMYFGRTYTEPMPTSEAPTASTSPQVEELHPRASNVPTEPASAPPVVCYELTDEERDLVERVVMAEAGAEPYEGQMAVAQCILNGCLLENLRPAQIVKKYQYAGARPAPTESVKKAVAAVFDEGEKVIDSEALFFYAPAVSVSAWHESQVCVATIGGHRFFKEADQVGEN